MLVWMAKLQKRAMLAIKLIGEIDPLLLRFLPTRKTYPFPFFIVRDYKNVLTICARFFHIALPRSAFDAASEKEFCSCHEVPL